MEKMNPDIIIIGGGMAGAAAAMALPEAKEALM